VSRCPRPLVLLAGLLLALGPAACGGGNDDPAAGGGAVAEPSAGTWKTWVLRAPDQITVPPPPAAGSATERAERDELRRLAAARAPELERGAREWEREPAIEPWMKESFELVAARPKDPVGASRAYALLGVAMYDAVVAAWDAKYRYRRKAPGGVEALFVPAADPSYPSEHAVVAGAASRVLSYLYPERPAASFDALAERIARSRVAAGVSWPSDMRAGLDLGRAVGDAAIAHARRDGSTRAWDGRLPQGKGAWRPPPGSLARPVSPMAGTWDTWVLESGRSLRPPPPPAYGSEAFRRQAEAVVRVKAALTPEQKKIASFWAGGQGTALPPGIWNQVVLSFLRREPQSLPRAARTIALLNVAQADAGVAAWDAKYAYWVTRPENAIRDLGIDRTWKPYLSTPFFPAYVSGHATYSGAAGEVLAHLYPAEARLFRAKAREAANSRVLGGIHYPMDGEQGLRMGRAIGRLVVARAQSDGAER
jgi:membrane-associated phospholipid phosphatase